MKLKTIFFSFFSLLATSCQSFLSISEDSDYREIFQFGMEVKASHNLNLVGFGGGLNEGIQTFNLTLRGEQALNLDDARVLFYDISSSFLSKINSNIKFRQGSFCNPYSIANISLSFMFPNVDAYISGMGNGFISDRDPLQYVYFFTYNPELAKSKITYQEPYEQLKNIVEQQRGL